MQVMPFVGHCINWSEKLLPPLSAEHGEPFLCASLGSTWTPFVPKNEISRFLENERTLSLYHW